jgi:hypothetical protein
MLKFACSDFPATVGVSSLGAYGIVRDVHVRTSVMIPLPMEHQPT